MNSAKQLDVYNMALGAIGISQTIDDVNEDSQQADTCNVFWAAARDQLLQDFPWDFAMQYATLVLLDTVTVPPGWVYAYACPDDCIQARRVLPPLPTNTTDLTNLGYLGATLARRYAEFDKLHPRIPYKVIADSETGQVIIVANLPDAILEYTAQVTDLSVWSPAAINALVYLLASKIVAPLSANPKYGEAAGKAYEAALLKAGSLSLSESVEKREPDSELIEKGWG